MKNLSSLLLVLLFPLGLMAQDDNEITVQTDDVIDVEAGTTDTITTTPIAPAGGTSLSTSADTGSNRKQGVEKIQVTGSHIKRIDVEGPSPVVTLDRKYMDESGYNSVADVLRDSTLSSFGVAREDSGSGASGSATIGLRGFGADKVLILMNGRRLPKIGGANSVDLNLIPFQALDRVEVLKDGASALYGSDALAGVINFITKKDYDGTTFSTRISVPEEVGGERQDISAVYGKNFAKGNVMAVYQYRNNKRVWDRDRDATRGMGQSTLGSPGSYKTGIGGQKAGWKAAEDCKETIPIGGGQEFCKFDYTPYSSGLPDIEQHNALMTGEYELNANLKTFAVANYTRRKTDWQYAPAPDIFTDNTSTGGRNYKIPKASAEKIGLKQGTVVDDDIELRYRLVDELGPRASRDTTDAYGATVGISGYIGDTWDWEVSSNYGASKLYNHGHAGYGHTGKIFNSIVTGGLKPLAPKSTKGARPDIQQISEAWVSSDLTSIQAIATGELGQALGANLSMAVGTAGAWESYQNRVDDITAAGDLFGGAGENGQGSRNYQSVFSELGVNYEKVELQLAGRVDSYSDFGSTFNPKVGIRFKPFKSLMFRGSAGTGFKAPSLNELYSSNSYGYPTYFDAVGCAANPGDPFSCRNQQYKTLSGGNKELKEETSFSYNLGTVIQPNRNFSITVDYWVTQIENAVGVDYNNIMLAEQKMGAAALASQGVFVTRDNDNRIVDLIAPNLNLAAIRSEGIDLGAGYTIRAGKFRIRPQIDHSYLLNNKEEAFPGLGFVNNLDEAGNPRWRNTSSISMGLYNHAMRITARTTAGQFKSEHLFDKSKKGRLHDYTEYDLNYDFVASWGGAFQVGAKNILGNARPLDDTGGFQDILNPALYDPIGRLYYMGYTQVF